MIDNTDAVKLLDSKREDSVFVATMNANNVNFGLPSVSTNQDLDFPLSGAMGKASSLVWDWLWPSRRGRSWCWMVTAAC